MKFMFRACFAALIAALPVSPAWSAETVDACGEVHPPVSARSPDLFDTLLAAPSEWESRFAEDDIWRAWVVAPDATAQDLLDEGMRRIRQSDFAGAEAKFDALIARCPDYSEGYNQRAYARFLAGKFDRSLEDIARTLEREPKHFAALSGRIRILFTQGRILLAREAMSQALAIHPWLRERRLLGLEPLPEGQLPKPEEDI